MKLDIVITSGGEAHLLACDLPLYLLSPGDFVCGGDLYIDGKDYQMGLRVRESGEGHWISPELLAAYVEAIELLRSLEWSCGEDNKFVCSVCGRREDEGHDDDCALGALLSRFPVEVDRDDD